jgi:hypothetical protein
MSLNNKEKTMKLTNIVAILIMSLFLVACGGGSSGSDPVVPPIEEPPVKDDGDDDDDDEIDPNAIYATTAELKAAKSFLLKQEYELTVSYKNAGNRNAYLSVCTEFTDGEYGIKVNYNTCLLRTSIESGYAGKLTVANDKNRLVMAIWYLDDTKNPRYEVWENSSNAEGERKFEVN